LGVAAGTLGLAVTEAVASWLGVAGSNGLQLDVGVTEGLHVAEAEIDCELVCDELRDCVCVCVGDGDKLCVCDGVADWLGVGEIGASAMPRYRSPEDAVDPTVVTAYVSVDMRMIELPSPELPAMKYKMKIPPSNCPVMLVNFPLTTGDPLGVIVV